MTRAKISIAFPTFFLITLFAKRGKYMSSDKWKTTCKICGKSFENFLATHIRRIHNMTPKQYYDECIRKEGEGICPVCGKETSFDRIPTGYREFCSTRCVAIGSIDRKEKACEKKYGKGITNPSLAKEVQEKRKETFLEKYGVDNPFRSEEVKEKIKDYWRTNYGVESVSQVESVRKKAERTCLKNHGVRHPSESKEIRDKQKKTLLEKYGVDNPAKNPDIYKKVLETNLKKYGKAYYCQTDKGRREASNEFYNKSKYFLAPKYTNRNSNQELKFSSLLKKMGYSFKKEYLVKSDFGKHYFDFAVFKNGNLDCLIDIDGEYYHGIDNPSLLLDRDILRIDKIPKHVKFLIIDSLKVKEGFKEFKKIYSMSFRKWKKRMRKMIPKEFPKQHFKKKLLLEDWKMLCNNGLSIEYNFGRLLLIQFCVKRLKDIWEEYRKTVYVSPVSEHNIFDAVDIFENVPDLRNKYYIKYKDSTSIRIKKHTAEKMLAVCSLGKRYVTEKLDNDSRKLAEFLKLNVKELYDED